MRFLMLGFMFGIISFFKWCCIAAGELTKVDEAALHTQEPLLTSSYETPLTDCDRPPEFIYPGEYLVSLVPWHTLIQHEKAIGFSLELHITDMWEFTDRIAYKAVGINEEKLRAIRSDHGVEEVSYEGVPEPEQADAELHSTQTWAKVAAYRGSLKLKIF